MTRIFDDPAQFADEAIDGFVTANPRYVRRVDGGVVRSTVTPAGQTAVVIGGGSGHYPAFAGLVGPGLAAGSACGNMFASPAASQVYRVAKAAHHGGGVLLSYGNYAGDVLHFGQAQERLNAEGIDTRTVVVTDDIASAPADELHKRRGIAGDFTVFKIAGAAAERGADLDEVERVAIKANLCTRTLGVAFSAPTLPGADAPLFTVPEGGMSLGLGIHGEPGISEHPMPTASELANLLLDRLLVDRPDDAGDRVVVLVNGLGSVKYDELFLFFGKVATRLAAEGLTITDQEVGELVTSLDMGGMSLTLFWVDDELERLWNDPADTPAFRKGVIADRPVIVQTGDEDVAHNSVDEANEEERTAAVVAARLLEITRSIIERHEAELGRIDAIAGDGDHGIGMRRGVEAAVSSARASVANGHGFRQLLTEAAEAWSERAGGTSGALWATGLSAIARSLPAGQALDTTDVATAVAAALGGIQRLGKAEVGDKTLVDVLAPYAQSLREQGAAGVPLVEALPAAAAVAQQAADATAQLTPRLGRARPLAEKSIGHPDAGAVSLALIIAGITEELV